MCIRDRQTAVAGLLQMIVDARHPLAHQHLFAGDHALILQLIEHRVQRALLRHNGPAAARRDLLHDLISVHVDVYKRQVHTILLLAMTRQEGARYTRALLRLNHPRTRRSGSAATGWLLVPAILMAARSKRRCGPAKDESFIFSKNGLFSQSLHNQIAPLGGQHICQPCHLHQPHNTHSP